MYTKDAQIEMKIRVPGKIRPEAFLLLLQKAFELEGKYLEDSCIRHETKLELKWR